MGRGPGGLGPPRGGACGEVSALTSRAGRALGNADPGSNPRGCPSLWGRALFHAFTAQSHQRTFVCLARGGTVCTDVSLVACGLQCQAEPILRGGWGAGGP